jgi:hypothetical protein
MDFGQVESEVGAIDPDSVSMQLQLQLKDRMGGL